MDGYNKNAGGGQHVTYERLRAMGNNGFQEPAVDFKDGKIIGTKRLFADGKFGTKDGKAIFMETQWRGLQAAGKQEQKDKFKYLINNGRANLIWQSRLPRSGERLRHGSHALSLYPDFHRRHGGTRTRTRRSCRSLSMMTARPRPWPIRRRRRAKAKPSCSSASPTGVVGNVINAGVNELILPELQADLGEYPEDFRCAGRCAAFVLQNSGIQLRLGSPTLQITLPPARAARRGARVSVLRGWPHRHGPMNCVLCVSFRPCRFRKVSSAGKAGRVRTLADSRKSKCGSSTCDRYRQRRDAFRLPSPRRRRGPAAPVGRHGLARPHRTHFVRRVVADSEDEIELAGTGNGELFPTLGPQVRHRVI